MRSRILNRNINNMYFLPNYNSKKNPGEELKLRESTYCGKMLTSLDRSQNCAIGSTRRIEIWRGEPDWRTKGRRSVTRRASDGWTRPGPLFHNLPIQTQNHLNKIHNSFQRNREKINWGWFWISPESESVAFGNALALPTHLSGQLG